MVALSTALGVAFVAPTVAALTTFEAYAAMDREHRNEVRSNAVWLLYKDAIERKDATLLHCMREKYVDGPKNDAYTAYARMRGYLEAGVEFHDDDSRVEYAIASHILSECTEDSDQSH